MQRLRTQLAHMLDPRLQRRAYKALLGVEALGHRLGGNCWRCRGSVAEHVAEVECRGLVGRGPDGGFRLFAGLAVNAVDVVHTAQVQFTQLFDRHLQGMDQFADRIRVGAQVVEQVLGFFTLLVQQLLEVFLAPGVQAVLQQVGAALFQLFFDTGELEVDVADAPEAATEAADPAVIEFEHRGPGVSRVLDVPQHRRALREALL
ncbi:hypothetical protein D3C79_846120 [compost metagenome]